MTYNQLYEPKILGEGSEHRYNSVYLNDGQQTSLSFLTKNGQLNLPKDAQPFLGAPLTSSGASNTPVTLDFRGRILHTKSNQHWKTTLEGLQRLDDADRLFPTRSFINYRLMLNDFAAVPISNMWTDTMGTAQQDNRYVVPAPPKVIERCILMTTRPGDLVIDPTCGGGTTAVVAEQWGRRWVTIDTSRVAKYRNAAMLPINDRPLHIFQTDIIYLPSYHLSAPPPCDRTPLTILQAFLTTRFIVGNLHLRCQAIDEARHDCACWGAPTAFFGLFPSLSTRICSASSPPFAWSCYSLLDNVLEY